MSASGPLPLSTEMRGYQEVDPSFPREIMDMAKANQANRIARMKEVVETDNRYKLRGQWMAFGLTLIAFALAAVLFFTGHNIGGTVFLAASVTGLIIGFLQSSRRGDD